MLPREPSRDAGPIPLGATWQGCASEPFACRHPGRLGQKHLWPPRSSACPEGGTGLWPVSVSRVTKRTQVLSGHEALIQGVSPGEACGRPLWPGPPDSRGVMGSSRAGWGPQTWLVAGSMAAAAGRVLDGAVRVDLKLEGRQGAPQQAAPPGGLAPHHVRRRHLL